MKAVFVLAIGIALVVSCLALDCPECQKDLCGDPGSCRFGETLDVCGCCRACYKGLGEECGGPWNVKGLCANHLTCVKFEGGKDLDPIQEFNGVGTCLALPK